MEQPISNDHPMVKQSDDIAGEVCRLIACRAMEGADAPAIASGLALALNRVAETGQEGAALRSIIATLLTEHVAAQDPPMPIPTPYPRCAGTGTVAHEDGQVLGDEPDGPSDYAGKIEAFFDEAARVGLGVEAMRAYLAEELRILNDAALHRGACGGASAGSFDPVSGRAFGDPAHPSS